jgi:hypothetical protein
MTKLLLLKLLELFAEDVTFKSGQKAPYSGLFRSGKEYIALTKEERFPPSFTGGWKLVVNVG